MKIVKVLMTMLFAVIVNSVFAYDFGQIILKSSF